MRQDIQSVPPGTPLDVVIEIDNEREEPRWANHLQVRMTDLEYVLTFLQVDNPHEVTSDSEGSLRGTARAHIVGRVVVPHRRLDVMAQLIDQVIEQRLEIEGASHHSGPDEPNTD